MSEIAIRTESLSRDFDAVRAVDRLTIQVDRGTVFGFLGPNGAGKTTTIGILLGLVEPSTGQAEVLGFNSRSHGGKIRERSGALLEHTGLYEQLTAEENLEFYGRVYRLGPAERRSRSEELLRRVELWERRSDRVTTWSRGMKQKLALARALMHRPPLLFLDEPTAGLDVMAAAALREQLAELVEREETTVFLTTHNMAEAERLAHRVAVIRHGRLLAIDSPERLRRCGTRLEVLGNGFSDSVLQRLKDAPGVETAEAADGCLSIDLAAGTPSAPLVALLVDSGAHVEEVRRGQASLEEVFLTLMEEGE